MLFSGVLWLPHERCSAWFMSYTTIGYPHCAIMVYISQVGAQWENMCLDIHEDIFNINSGIFVQ